MKAFQYVDKAQKDFRTEDTVCSPCARVPPLPNLAIRCGEEGSQLSPLREWDTGQCYLSPSRQLQSVLPKPLHPAQCYLSTPRRHYSHMPLFCLVLELCILCPFTHEGPALTDGQGTVRPTGSNTSAQCVSVFNRLIAVADFRISICVPIHAWPSAEIFHYIAG